MKLKHCACVAFLPLLLIGCVEVGEPIEEPEDAAELTLMVPPILVVDADRVRIMLDEARGNVVVANFWATWCPPCVREMPELVKFYNEHHGKGVTFLSLSVDHPATIEDAVEPFVDKHDLPFTVYVVDEQDPAAIAEKTGLEMTGAVPTTWVIDRDGNPVRAWVEETTAAELHEAIQPLLTPVSESAASDSAAQ